MITVTRSATPYAKPDMARAFSLRFNVHTHNIVLSPVNCLWQFTTSEGAAFPEHRADTTRRELKLTTNQ